MKTQPATGETYPKSDLFNKATRWTHHDDSGFIPYAITTGLDYEAMTEQRKGYENFVYQNGVYDLGTKGDMRRNERNLMWNLDPYIQTHWQLTSALGLDAGARYSSVWFDSNDRYVVGKNGDDSGEASYHKWLPAAALKYAMTPQWNVYLSAGRGFETPTINELSYRPDGQSGLNFALQPATNTTVEAGSKWQVGTGMASLSVFNTDTKNEIVVAASDNGRTSYQNAGKTRRRGVELGWDQQFAPAWRAKLAWTLLDATYRENAGDAIQSGNRIPGIARNSAYASFGWVPEEGWYAGAEVRYMSDIQVNDANSEQAPAYTVTALNTGYKYVLDNWTVDLYTRVDNLFKIDAIGRNPVTGYGSGLMQIDSQHFNELSRYGIKPDHLLSDACLNIYTGAYYLAQAFKKWGVSWDAVGAYNAGFKKTPRQAARRYEYAKKIHYYYTAIKASKRTSSKDQKIAMN
nr:TonB-dependent receptor [Klebsiella quasipneumoniae]